MSLSHLEVKGIGNGRKPIVLLNQKVPRIPIPKNRGVANKREVSMFRLSLFRVGHKKRETFAFLEVQVDKNLAVGEKIWQIGG